MVLRLTIVILVLLVFVCVDAKRRGKKPKRSCREELEIEILSVNQTCATARIKPCRAVKKYFISVEEKDLADFPSYYTTSLKKRDRRSDGYLYVNTGNTLEPGKVMELSVTNNNPRDFSEIEAADFFTDCDDHSFFCVTDSSTIWGKTCLESDQLCDGFASCENGTDEATLSNGDCAVFVPKRPTPPPPPTDTPCMIALAAAQNNGNSKLPDCGPDGHYQVMKCDGEVGFSCHCIHPLTGEILYTEENSPEETSYFYKDCVARRKLERPM